MIPSSGPSSNWDFTAVINLLRSPTYRSQDHSPFSDPPDCPDPQRASHATIKHDVEKLDIRKQSLKDEHVSSPKLGDFGSLWEVLGKTSSLPPASTGPTNIEHDSRHGEPPPPSQLQNGPVAILKRPQGLDAVSNETASTLATPSPVPVVSITDTTSPQYGKFHTEPSASVQQRRRRGKLNDDTSSSESNAEGDSDNPLSIFDRPLSKPRNIHSMIPPQVGVPEAQAGPLDSTDTPPSSFDEVDGFLTPSAVKYSSSASTPRLQPIAYKTAADQRVGLLTKLMTDFPDYAELLVETGRSKKSKKLDVSTRPIHVFVDMSNIMVGFHDTMKILRDIPVQTRIRRLPLSYQNFSLILERGRSTAKRVLVGSDRIAAINESEQLGYEANILNRVQKVKQLTPRQLRFRKSLKATSHDGGHGSETNDAPEERWVEQGVDEILHLKILESLLDTDEPATVVLATGDAAEAEFSGGFMKMVERALRRGWRVELVSFSQVTSYAYKRKEFRSRWGSQFQLIMLDNYVEELFKM